jgi:putative membrane protein
MKAILLMAAVSAAVFSACTSHPMNGSTPGWGHMMGYGGYGGMFMWLILVLVAGFVIYLAVNRRSGKENRENSVGENPMEILKRRYANGEISKDEFNRMKNELQS